jgi:hypothetical protein
MYRNWPVNICSIGPSHKLPRMVLAAVALGALAVPAGA